MWLSTDQIELVLDELKRRLLVATVTLWSEIRTLEHKLFFGLEYVTSMSA